MTLFAASSETPGVLRPTARPGLEDAGSTVSRLATPSSRSQQAAEFSRSETARQIRASFENLVRASPSPQVCGLCCCWHAGTHLTACNLFQSFSTLTRACRL